MKETWTAWFGLLGGAIAWFVHLAGGSVIAEAGCVAPGSIFTWLGISAVAWALVLLTLGTLATTIASAIVSWRLRADPMESRRFVGNAGVIGNVFFAMVILAQAAVIPTLITSGC